MAIIAPSLLSADFTRMGEEVREIESVGTKHHGEGSAPDLRDGI